MSEDRRTARQVMKARAYLSNAPQHRDQLALLSFLYLYHRRAAHRVVFQRVKRGVHFDQIEICVRA